MPPKGTKGARPTAAAAAAVEAKRRRVDAAAASVAEPPAPADSNPISAPARVKKGGVMALLAKATSLAPPATPLPSVVTQVAACAPLVAIDPAGSTTPLAAKACPPADSEEDIGPGIAAEVEPHGDLTVSGGEEAGDDKDEEDIGGEEEDYEDDDGIGHDVPTDGAAAPQEKQTKKWDHTMGMESEDSDDSDDSAEVEGRVELMRRVSKRKRDSEEAAPTVVCVCGFCKLKSKDFGRSNTVPLAALSTSEECTPYRRLVISPSRFNMCSCRTPHTRLSGKIPMMDNQMCFFFS
jgi:hypothetical protein